MSINKIIYCCFTFKISLMMIRGQTFFEFIYRNQAVATL